MFHVKQALKIPDEMRQNVENRHHSME